LTDTQHIEPFEPLSEEELKDLEQRWPDPKAMRGAYAAEARLMYRLVRTARRVEELERDVDEYQRVYVRDRAADEERHEAALSQARARVEELEREVSFLLSDPDAGSFEQRIGELRARVKTLQEWFERNGLAVPV